MGKCFTHTAVPWALHATLASGRCGITRGVSIQARRGERGELAGERGRVFVVDLGHLQVEHGAVPGDGPFVFARAQVLLTAIAPPALSPLRPCEDDADDEEVSAHRCRWWSCAECAGLKLPETA